MALLITTLALAFATVSFPSASSGGICGVNTGNCDAGVCAVNTGDCEGGICGANAGWCSDGGICGVNTWSCYAGICGVNLGWCGGGICGVNTWGCWSGICGVNIGNCGTPPWWITGARLAVPIPVLNACDSSNPNYNPTQTIHAFAWSASQAGSPAIGTVLDTSGCATGDGDFETGLGAAAFPEVSQGACDPPAPVSGHHSGGVGATATVQSNTANLPMDFVFGTDGQQGGLDVATSPCTGNDIISSSYDTDPFDCGQGITGHFPGLSATLAPNPNPHDGSTTDPDPWAVVYGSVSQGSVRSDPNGVSCFGVNDGSAWAFLLMGPVGSANPLSLGLSTPLNGIVTAP